jgi:hypothetical protein
MPRSGFIQIGSLIYNDSVFATHLGDEALDPDLAGPWLGREFVDAQADRH